MADAEITNELNSGYQMPPDAGPAWRHAASMGMDMTLLEYNLTLTPWERLLQNDRALRMASAIREGSPFVDGESS